MKSHDIHYTAPVHRWDEGLPLGNGLLGLLVWGDGNPLNLSVDRSDLWDNRPDPATTHKDYNWKKLTQLIDRNDMKTLYRIFESSRDTPPYPTKLPCGRIRLTLPKAECRKPNGFDSRLDFATAISQTRIGNITVTGLVHAERPLILVRVRGARPKVDFLSPFDCKRAKKDTPRGISAGPNDLLRYPPLERGTRSGVQFIRQRCAQGMSYTVAWTLLECADLSALSAAATRRGAEVRQPVASKQSGDKSPHSKITEWILYLTVQMAQDDRDPVSLAVDVLNDAKKTGLASLEQSHRAWWRRYWDNSHVALPDARIERLWYAEMYKLGACAREDTPPISLQGVWTADEMALPPWRGDYHHDLNTQMSYWPVHTAGRIEQSRGFARWLHDLLPKYRAFACDFYGAPGANVPCCHGLNGEIIPGWSAYSFSRANAAWLIQHLWWHYRYTLDETFLRETAWPFIRDVTRFCASQLTRERDGRYHLHYSSSPEYNNNWRTSFGTDSTYDLSLIRYALEVASQAARIVASDEHAGATALTSCRRVAGALSRQGAIGESQCLKNRGHDVRAVAPACKDREALTRDAREWDRIRAALQPYHLAPTLPKWPAPEGGLAIWKGQRLMESHRHLAQCMPLFPLGDLNVEGSDRDREIIRNTMSEIECMGTGFWCGYSFSWYACIGARLREPNRVLWGLHNYLDYFISPNTFHLNGDYKSAGASRFHYRPFTLEGNFGAAHAVNEMLLQSWGDKLRLFPAVPAEWSDVSFTDLRAEGAFRVSAWRKRGAFVRAEIVSEKGQSLRLEHPAPGHTVVVRESGRRFKAGTEIRFPTTAGTRYRIELAGKS